MPSAACGTGSARTVSWGIKRQVSIGPYIVDFACLNRRLIVELDGGQHAENLGDQKRDTWLRAQGFQVLRFWNNDVLKATR